MEELIKKPIGLVTESLTKSIIVEIIDYALFEKIKSFIQIGRYLKASDGNSNYVICIINNIKSFEFEVKTDSGYERKIKFIIDTQPLGTLIEGKFERGGMMLPVPTEPVFLLEDSLLEQLFKKDSNYSFKLGKLIQNKNVDLYVDGNKLFSKHLAVVGSTGSGKSCTVAKILQEIVGIEESKNKNKDTKKNSHIIIFDLHSEYKAAFNMQNEENFGLNNLSIDSLKLPYWLMNSEELESLFIESNEQNSHNQISFFKKAVIANKEKYNPGVKVTYDSPLYFNLVEVYNYILNSNNEVIGKLNGEDKPKLANGTLVTDYNKYFEGKLEFTQQSTAKDTKASNGPFNGEFNRFLSRLETKLSDKRLNFLLEPTKDDGSPHQTEDFEEILKQFLGYLDKSNITIIDLSGVPFEVLSITVSLISRLIFDFAFYYTKFRHLSEGVEDQSNNVPFMIVCEEAHNYIPRHDRQEYRSSKKSLERIAKEGRKYGLGLMVVSQRPSEVSETIFAQCNNFIALRLTNESDQRYVKSLMTENSSTIADILPNLSAGECIIVGDSVLIPTVARLDMPSPKPQSDSVKFHEEWQKDWQDIKFEDIIKRWRE